MTVIKIANPFQNKSDDSSFMIEIGVLLEIFGATFDPWISEPAYELPAWNEKLRIISELLKCKMGQFEENAWKMYFHGK